jgi:hypothetical protein
VAASPMPEQPPQQPGGAPPPGGQPDAGGQGAGGPGNAAIEPIRSIAQALAAYAQQHQEATEEITQIFPLLQRVMARVAGNGQRTPDKQAPPQG